MVARVATFEGVNVQEAERTMDEAEAAVGPLIEGLAGYDGHMQLISSGGKVLSITLYDTMESAEAAEPMFDEEMPRQLGHIFEAGRAAARPSIATTWPPTRAGSGDRSRFCCATCCTTLVQSFRGPTQAASTASRGDRGPRRALDDPSRVRGGG